MALDVEDFVLLGIWTIFVILGILFIYRTTTKNREANILSLGVVFGIIGVSFAAFRPFMPSDSFVYSNYWIFSNGIFYLLMYFFIYIHFSLADRTTPNIILSIILAGLMGLGIGSSIVILSISGHPPEQLITINDFAHDSLKFLSFLYATVVVWKTWKYTEEKNGLIELLALLIFLITVIPAVIGNYFKGIGMSSELYTIGDILSFIGIALLTSNYIINPDYLYRIPKPLYQVTLFNMTGLTIYSKAVKSKGIDIEKIPTQVISAIVTAVSVIMKEGISESSYLKRVEATNHTLLFSKRGDITAMILCESPTYFIKKSLDNFLKFMPEEIIKQLEEAITEVDEKTMKQIDEILVKAYPYIDFI